MEILTLNGDYHLILQRLPRRKGVGHKGGKCAQPHQFSKGIPFTHEEKMRLGQFFSEQLSPKADLRIEQKVLMGQVGCPSGHRPGGIWFDRTGLPAVPPEYGPCDPPPSFLFLIDTRLKWPKGYSSMKKERRMPMGHRGSLWPAKERYRQGQGRVAHCPGPRGNSMVKAEGEGSGNRENSPKG